MSVAGLATLGVIRDGRSPLKSDLGKDVPVAAAAEAEAEAEEAAVEEDAVEAASEAEAPPEPAAEPAAAPEAEAEGEAESTTDMEKPTPSNLDIAVTAVPTGAVTIYTAWIALVSASVKLPTPEEPNPNLFEPLRWLGFAVLLAVTAGLVVRAYRARGGTRTIPVPEVILALVVAAGWGLGMPESPLVPRLGEDYTVLVPGLIAAVSAGLVLVFIQPLKSQA